MTNVKDVAAYLLSLFKEDAEERQQRFGATLCTSDISNLKLQKLLYYCQAYSLALIGKPMFDEEIQAWDYGPVVPLVYDDYKKYHSSDIPLVDINPFIPSDIQVAAIIRFVKHQKGSFSAVALIDMTHAEKPWQIAHNKGRNTTITNESIREYFENELCKEMSFEEEEHLWNAASEPLSDEDIKELLSNV